MFNFLEQTIDEAIWTHNSFEAKLSDHVAKNRIKFESITESSKSKFVDKFIANALTSLLKVLQDCSSVNQSINLQDNFHTNALQNSFPLQEFSQEWQGGQGGRDNRVCFYTLFEELFGEENLNFIPQDWNSEETTKRSLSATGSIFKVCNIISELVQNATAALNQVDIGHMYMKVRNHSAAESPLSSRTNSNGSNAKDASGNRSGLIDVLVDNVVSTVGKHCCFINLNYSEFNETENDNNLCSIYANLISSLETLYEVRLDFISSNSIKRATKATQNLSRTLKTLVSSLIKLILAGISGDEANFDIGRFTIYLSLKSDQYIRILTDFGPLTIEKEFYLHLSDKLAFTCLESALMILDKRKIDYNDYENDSFSYNKNSNNLLLKENEEIESKIDSNSNKKLRKDISPHGGSLNLNRTPSTSVSNSSDVNNSISSRNINT